MEPKGSRKGIGKSVDDTASGYATAYEGGACSSPLSTAEA